MAVIIAGATSLFSQIIFFRELLVCNQGNELVLGPLFAIWLLLTGLGSWSISIRQQRSNNSVFMLALIQCLLSLILPATIAAIRIMPSIFHNPWGEIPHPGVTLSIMIISLLPFCLLSGMIFPLSTQIFRTAINIKSATIPMIYFLESLGSGIASLAISVFMISLLDSKYIVVFICVINLFSAGILLNQSVRQGFRRWLAGVTTCLLAAIIIVSIFQCDAVTLDRQWQPYQRIASTTSRFGAITITRIEETIQFHENGKLLFSYPDVQSTEESVHFVMLQHKKPAHVLLIGGGLSGAIDQILQHPGVVSVTYTELDPALIRLGRTYLPVTVTRTFADPRVRIIHNDGRHFLNHTDNVFDVIILQTPEPSTLQLNRFYTLEFYQRMVSCLSDSGVMGFQLQASENVIGRDLFNYLSCMNETLHQAFADIVILPGNNITFIAGKAPHSLIRSAALITNRIHERRLTTSYVQDYYINFNLSPGRMTYINDRLQSDSWRFVNRDFHGTAHYFKFILWTTQFNDHIKRCYNLLQGVGMAGFILLIFIIGGALLIYIMRNTIPSLNRRHLILKTAVALSGFSSFSMQLIFLLAFQTQYGYMYYQLALIMSAFMAGMAIGAYLTLINSSTTRNDMQRIIHAQIVMIVLIVVFGLFAWRASMVSELTGGAIFMGFSCATGLIGGYQFSRINQEMTKTAVAVERIAGTMYGLDLLGASCGALLTGLIFIPLFGILNMWVVLLLMNGWLLAWLYVIMQKND
jgi:spermidine synthase